MTYAQLVSEPVPAVVEIAMCGGLIEFVDLLSLRTRVTARNGTATTNRLGTQLARRHVDHPLAVALAARRGRLGGCGPSAQRIVRPRPPRPCSESRGKRNKSH